MVRAQTGASPVDFGISDPIVPVAIWNGGTVNRFQVDGVLTLNGTPVVGATIRANDYTLPQPTSANGGFTVRRDQTVVDQTVLKVAGMDGATISGKLVSDTDRAALETA